MFVAVTDLKEGMLLSSPVHAPDGSMLLGDGSVINEWVIKKMLAWGVDEIKVKNKIEEPKMTIEEIEVLLKEAEAIINEEELKVEREKIKKIYAELIKTSQEFCLGVRYQDRVDFPSLIALVDNIMFPLLSHPSLFRFLHSFHDVQADYLYRHSIEVSFFSGLLAKKLVYSDKEIKNIMLAALIHDIGKLKISFSLVTKSGDISVQEKETIKSHHVLLGCKFLLDIKCPYPFILTVVGEHHERMNGSGYPRKLLTSQIHHYSKIVGIADVYSALINDHYYAKAINSKSARDIIEKEMAGQFDNKFLETFFSL